MPENPGANRSTEVGSDRSPLVRCVDASGLSFGGTRGAEAPAQDQEQLRRKLAKIDVFTASLSILACSAILFTESSPVTSPQTVRQLQENSTAGTGLTGDGGCPWLYHNAYDERLLIGDFDLRRFFIR